MCLDILLIGSIFKGIPLGLFDLSASNPQFGEIFIGVLTIISLPHFPTGSSGILMILILSPWNSSCSLAFCSFIFSLFSTFCCFLVVSSLFSSSLIFSSAYILLLFWVSIEFLYHLCSSFLSLMTVSSFFVHFNHHTFLIFSDYLCCCFFKRIKHSHYSVTRVTEDLQVLFCFVVEIGKLLLVFTLFI